MPFVSYWLIVLCSSLSIGYCAQYKVAQDDFCNQAEQRSHKERREYIRMFRVFAYAQFGLLQLVNLLIY